uniref:Tctex1 domain containing 1 n=1 Tax=Pelusios castaneus TaxID=367368 RepID=A0A8C8SXS1_9SAUR
AQFCVVGITVLRISTLNQLPFCAPVAPLLTKVTACDCHTNKCITLYYRVGSLLQIPVSSAKPKEKFSCARTEELLREYLPTKLSHVTYEPAGCAKLSAALSDEIKHLVKEVTPPRYKLVVNVTIGNKDKDETVDILVTSQCLWDPHSDNFTSSQYVNETLFCVVLVHAVYFE